MAEGAGMIPNQFRCLLIERDGASTSSVIATLPTDRLPSGNVTIRVEYSSLNYKDALAYQGHRGIVSQLPHIPGVDAAGTVIESECDRFRPGDEVLVTGYDFGQGHWGGWSELIRVDEAWIVPRPPSLTAREAMILGTAGFTAAQSVLALQRNGIVPSSGEIVVTGATGGVGSLAIRILAPLGYEIVAVTGKGDQHNSLLAIGAKRVVDRSEVTDDSQRPMLSAKWAGAVDTVGGEMLSSVLRATLYGGCVAACGLVAGAELAMTVYPFLLRGVTLCGIASADCPYNQRMRIWSLLAGDWKPKNLDAMVTEVDLERLPELVEQMLAGKVVGRVIVVP